MFVVNLPIFFSLWEVFLDVSCSVGKHKYLSFARALFCHFVQFDFLMSCTRTPVATGQLDTLGTDLHGVDDGLSGGSRQRAGNEPLLDPQAASLFTAPNQPLDLESHEEEVEQKKTLTIDRLVFLNHCVAGHQFTVLRFLV